MCLSSGNSATSRFNQLFSSSWLSRRPVRPAEGTDDLPFRGLRPLHRAAPSLGAIEAAVVSGRRQLLIRGLLEK